MTVETKWTEYPDQISQRLGYSVILTSPVLLVHKFRKARIPSRVFKYEEASKTRGKMKCTQEER
jgi:hypothetical protein